MTINFDNMTNLELATTLIASVRAYSDRKIEDLLTSDRNLMIRELVKFYGENPDESQLFL